ncbi:unnamed protein product [Hermetia illucens]|uniref:Uncharacterized protein n=1 Tax=Hermetia illucens TaxID=343691 RepID=A0A7R8V8H5_HERIL|nr:major facilitator superfamily domain-containing protein 12-like [Hermetia illucens]XP_037925735.1 major facilitator superfamily domain-containing protein 12-like [Hermetia illucens]CAD7094095.1 unnamed protein product [Hermetia illucens]
MSDDKSDSSAVASSDGLLPRSISRPQESSSSRSQQSGPRLKNYGSIVSTPSASSSTSPSSTDPGSGDIHQREGDEQQDPDETTPLRSSLPPSASSSGSSTPEDMKSTLSFFQKFGFGLGHVYNDLCAGVWFSYTLLFMQSVRGLPAVETGALIMLGQVCDAIATPIVGVLADRYMTKRKWHIAGTGLVFLSFPMIFSICPWCSNSGHWWPPVYFSVFIVIFQAAWAIVQISHFAMIPELSKTTKDRADLTATRYSASVIANLVVFLITWFVLNGRTTDSNNIGPTDERRFRDIALILTLVGVTMSVLFHFSLALSDYEHRRLMALLAMRGDETESRSRRSSVRGRGSNLSQEHDESRYHALDEGQGSPSNDTEDLLREIEGDQVSTTNSINRALNNHTGPERKRRTRNFLKSPLLYQNALLYVFARLFMTTSLLYMPLWLDERSYKMPAAVSEAAAGVETLATVPLVSFLSSFVSSMMLKQANKWIPHGLAYLLGSGVSIAVCAWVAFASPKSMQSIQLYVIAMLFGSGSSVTMVSSLCITADMIGKHTYQGGFIYSAVTFADKLITGIVVAIIEAMKCKQRSDCPTYYQNVLACGCGLAAILGILTLWTLRCTARFTRRRRLLRNESTI